MGVGTNLITSSDCPAFGGVYKLSAIFQDGEYTPKIKLSNNPVKVTNPGNKRLYVSTIKNPEKSLPILLLLMTKYMMKKMIFYFLALNPLGRRRSLMETPIAYVNFYNRFIKMDNKSITLLQQWK